ncbi:MAG TPA: glycosyltransferase [Thermoplasmata archaeon]|nr:glycosyltransferase [Thermoplasmata archaeon]
MGTVGVEIAVKDDERLLLALDSLSKQTRLPDHVLVAASPKTPERLVEAVRVRWPSIHVEVVRFEGGPVDARTSSLPYLRQETTVFLDSDEIAPPGWLATIVAPIEAGRAAYTGGPTRPLRAAENPIERYYELLEASIYEDLVPSSVTYLPLGNSAWKTRLLLEYRFDPRVTAEDHDLETRVQRAGHVGLYLPEAWVYHDKSNETSYVRWARKRYLYLFQMAMSMIKNGELGERLRERRKPVRHPLRYVEAMMKPFALAHAWVRWSRVGDGPRARPPAST